MTKVVSALTARTQFGQILKLASKKSQRFIVDRRGEPLAVIMGIQDFIKAVAPEPEVLTLIGEASKRISPFLLQGRKGVSSVITPSTFPYIYTLSKKTSLALERLAASTALCMMRGHSSRHTLKSYFRPTTRNATLEPETACRVSLKFERSAATASAAPGTSLGFQLTSRTGSLRAVSSLTSSLPTAPPAPRMVTILRMLRPVAEALQLKDQFRSRCWQSGRSAPLAAQWQEVER